MTGTPTEPVVEYFDLDRMTAAIQAAIREARLEHARLGRPVCEGRNGHVVWLSPAEVFASYGLDEHGNPPATSPRPSA
jgi:hypothetical protein